MRRKDWESHQQYICDLASRGHSAPAIQQLLKENGLTVKIRTLREKLRDWGHRRCDLDLARSWDNSLRAEDVQHGPNTCHLRHERYSPYPSQSLSGLDTGHGTTHLAITTPTSYPTFPQLPFTGQSLRILYSRLVLALSEGRTDDTAHLLASCNFSDGCTSMLHHATQVTEISPGDQRNVVCSILEFLQKSGLDINHKDSHGRTAVELAVKADNLSLLQTLIGGGASVNAQNTEGHQLLHVALLSHASLGIYDCLLRNGADADAVASAGLTERPPVSCRFTPINFVIQRLSECCNAGDKASTVWFAIAGKLIQHGAKYTADSMKPLLLHFAQIWMTTGGSQDLLDDMSPLLSAFLKDGLDPTDPLTKLQPFECACSSLAHLAFFHSASKGLATVLIEDGHLTQHGKSILRCLLTGCRNGSATRPDLDRLLRLLISHPIDTATFNPLEYILKCDRGWHSWTDKASFIRSLLELIPKQCVLCSRWPEEHGKIIEEIAKCPNLDIRYKLCEYIFKTRNQSQSDLSGAPSSTCQVQTPTPIFISVFFNQVLSDIHQLSHRDQRSEAAFEAVKKRLNYQANPSKDVVGCFVHLVTKDIIQSPGGPSKVLLYRLLLLRKELQLPDVQVPNNLLLEMLKDADKEHGERTTLQKQQHDVYGGFYPGSDQITPFWTPVKGGMRGTKRQRRKH